MQNRIKVVRSEGYNFNFDIVTGLFVRWGKTRDDDPTWSPLGPEILDCEVSTICHGTGTPCAFCYKSAGPKGENMSLDTFKQILSKMNLKVLTQIAFGIGDLEANPDLFAMFNHCWDNGIAANVTINGYGLTKTLAKKLNSLCGAVAVSCYDKDLCYNAVKMLTDAGLEQTNIHCLLSESNLDKCMSVLEDVKTDPRLAKLRALVFLHLKPKGRAKNCACITSRDKYQALIDRAFELGVSIGFDSCGANLFASTIKNRPDADEIMKCVEPCESGLFSAYINTKGEFFPCSFAEGALGWENGIDVLSCDTFTDVWHHPRVADFRNVLVGNCRDCPFYEICR